VTVDPEMAPHPKSRNRANTVYLSCGFPKISPAIN
jgi:hypothetical protein